MVLWCNHWGNVTMCKFDWFLFLEYLKILLTWPPIVLGIFWLFRADLASFLNRVIKGNFFGQSVEAAPLVTQNTSKSREPDILEEKVSQNNQGSGGDFIPPELKTEPHIDEWIAWVKHNPGYMIQEYRNVLFKYNAERLFNLIFGSQINMLTFLASHSNERFKLSDLSKFHKEFQEKTPDSPYQINEYMAFLVQWGLINQEESSGYAITENGK